jgi:DNA (cytosine-5)-methyltransferase 1
VYHHTDCRVLSLDELRALASFPFAFCLAGDYEDAWQRIGNSVPPLFMEAIARNIRIEILSKL